MYKVIPNFENYLVYDNGTVYNITTKKWLKGTIRLNGYKVYRLSKDGTKYEFYAHRLVAENFLPNPNNFSIVNHIDGNKQNNVVSNLEWCDQSTNMKHAHKNALINKRRTPEYCLEDKEGEEWVLIKDFDNYMISNFGRVKNFTTNRLLKPSIACGYYKVRLSKDGKVKDFLLHYLVSEYFNKELPIKYSECIDHIDGNKLNNCANNLRVISLKDNSKFAFYEQRLTNTLSPIQQFSLDGKLLATFPSCREAGRVLNLDSSSISKASRGILKTCGGFIFKKLS